MSYSRYAAVTQNPAQQPVPGRDKRLPELDGLRGIAILLVFLLHYVTNSRSHEGNFGHLYQFAQVFRLGWVGVDLFFVLSGFLIGGILLETRDSPNHFGKFYVRRVHRILPVYYGWLAIYFLVGLVLIGSPHFSAVAFTSLHPMLYVLFVQNILPAPTSLFAHYMVSPTWSLAVEEQFYLVTPVIFRIVSLRRLTQLLLACVVAVPILRYFIFSGPNGSQRSAILTLCRADALAWGILAAIVWRSSAKGWLQQRVLLLKVLGSVLFAGALAMIKWMPGPRTAPEAALQYSWIALLCVSTLLIVLLDGNSVLAGITRWSFLRKWGTISYCFYLIHLGILGAFHWIFFRDLPHIDDLAGCAVTIFAAVFSYNIAKLSWKYFERPLIERGHAVSDRISEVPAGHEISDGMLN